MRTYRIGKLVNETGITQDTLKFYERQGIMTSNKEDSGYRYYNVPDCGTIMQIRYLRQLGFTVKEISHLMKDADSKKVVNIVEQKIEEINKSVQRLKHTKEALESYHALCIEINEKPNQWLIEDSPDYYFLKHTTAANFLEEKSISKYIKRWANELIDVQMSLLIPKQNIYSENVDECFWGFSVKEKSPQTDKMDKDKLIMKIHFGKCFKYIFSQESKEFSSPKILDIPLKLIDSLGYSVAGDVLCHYISQTAEIIDDKKVLMDNFVIMIPIF